jgi:DNA-binding NtrC family response regulator
MSNQPETLRDSMGGKAEGEAAGTALPGLLLIHSLGQPTCVPLPLTGPQLEIGRGDGTSALPNCPRTSRRHASVAFDGERFRITDRGSQNGTYVDGVRVEGSVTSATARVLRTGDSLFLFSGDLRPYKAAAVTPGDSLHELVQGPALRAVLAQATRAAQFGRTLHITGESGSGKEGVARAYHAASASPGGPFVPINCATIAAGVAERLLFGARRGAFSGAVADTEGLIQSADGGTLFLDEVAELDLAVQAKLLRVIETSEVLAMGAVRPRKVNLQLCTASHRDLRAEVIHGRFREDLYFRINSPTVIVPPLRRRLEEMPWLIALALRSFAGRLLPHSAFVEACLLRMWPGNVREFLAEVRAAAQEALGSGASRIELSHLSVRAGQPLDRPAEPQATCAVVFHPPLPKLPRELPDRARIEDALHKTDGNISATARLLGLHRTQLKRLFEKYGIHIIGREVALEPEGDP